jgi:hypothetical protein
MDAIIRNVKDIATTDRQALEHVIGQHLAENQQVVIHIVNVDVPSSAPGDPAPGAQPLPDWCNVYHGLSDEAISAVEETVLTRADLSRSSH